MRNTQQRKIIIWPVYFDSRYPRKGGRRAPLSFSVENPPLDLIAKAARASGLKIIIDENSKHPKTWFDSKGRIIVYTDLKKSEVIKRIGRELRNICRKERKK